MHQIQRGFPTESYIQNQNHAHGVPIVCTFDLFCGFVWVIIPGADKRCGYRLQTGGGCRTFPGVFQEYLASTDHEQRLVLTPGGQGCLDDSIGNIMKYFVLVLGRRNEHQRPDRDQYIQVHEKNIPAGEMIRCFCCVWLTLSKVSSIFSVEACIWKIQTWLRCDCSSVPVRLLLDYA